MEDKTRRSFLKTTFAATGLAAGLNAVNISPVKAAFQAKKKIRVGFIGVGNRGSQLLGFFRQNEDVEVAALCDVYEPYRQRDHSKVDPLMLEKLGGRIPELNEKFDNDVPRYSDFRDVLAQKDIDAVVVATPDHWHAIQTIEALRAGKDVYVEKPLTITVKEGRAMVEEAKKTDRVVQVGLNRRGSPVYRKLYSLVRDGGIGKVTIARAYRTSNMYPNGIGNEQPVDPPAGFDWDTWLGPRAYRPFQYNIAPYFFRWWKSYSSQVGNWGVHYIDTIRWMIGEESPVAVSAHGGLYALKDDRTIPDTMEISYELPSGAILIFGVYEAAGGEMIDRGELELCGTKGTLIADERGYRIIPSGDGQFQHRGKLIEPANERFDQLEDSTAYLVRNFLDCVHSRQQPFCPLEDGHRSTTFAHLANISLELKSRIEWDPVRESITNIKKADKLLHYRYRKPWSL